jgi:hypothetical protein
LSYLNAATRQHLCQFNNGFPNNINTFVHNYLLPVLKSPLT